MQITPQLILAALGMMGTLLIAMGVCSWLIYSGIKKAQRQATSDEVARLIPHEKATEAWRNLAEGAEKRQKNLEHELDRLRQENDRLRSQCDELNGKCQGLLAVNLRLEGELETLQKRVEVLEQASGK